MAIRRAKQKAQVIAKLSEQAPLIVAMTRKFYFVTLTNTSVVVNSANRFTNRPGPVVAAFHRDATPLTGVNRGNVWSKMHLHFPNTPKPTRLNVHRYWRGEFDQPVAAVPQGGVS